MISLFLCALLTAYPLLTLSAPVYQIPLGQNSVGEISNEFFKELEDLAKIIELYSDDSARLRQDALLKNLDVVHQWNNVDVQGYVAVDNKHGDIYVVFDREYEYADALVDLVIPLPLEAAGVYGSGGLVHGGFQRGWEVVEKAVLDRASWLRSNYGQHELNIIGRGIGGSVAALAALNFAMQGWEPKLTTFGQPRFGDAEFMKFFDEHITPEKYRRVTHITDPVPMLEFSELGLIHTNEEYFIHKPFPPYLASDIHICTLDSEDPICSAHARTSPFDLPFTQSPYLTSKPAAPIETDIFLDLPFEFTELDIEFFLLPLELDSDFSLDAESHPAALPPSPFLSLVDPSPPNPNLNKRSLGKALEYFHLPKHQLEASLAEAEAIAAYEAALAQDPNNPSFVPCDSEKLGDEEDLISQASSIIVYNGRPVEMDGRPTIGRRSLLSDKGRIGRCKKDRPGLGLTLESTTPAYTVSEARVQEEVVGVGENSFEDEVVNVQKGQNFRVYNGIPVRKDVDIRYTDGVGGEVERARPAPVKPQEEKKVEVEEVQDEVKRLLEKRGCAFGWGGYAS